MIVMLFYFSYRHSFGRSLLFRIESLHMIFLSLCLLLDYPQPTLFLGRSPTPNRPTPTVPPSFNTWKMHTINLVIVPITIITFYRASLSYAATSTPAPYPCPDLDGSSYADATGSKYNIQCSTDYPGNDLPAVHTDTFEECLQACDAYVPGSSAEAHNYAPCVGVSWGAGNPSANCYLKYQIPTVKSNDVGLSSGYLANDTLPNSRMTSPRSSQSTTSVPATGTAQAATSTTLTTQPTSRPSSGPTSHSGVGVGAGIGVGVGVVGLAILAGIFYLMRRRLRRRAEEPLELSAEEDDEKFDELRKQSPETRVDELPADNEPGELFDPRGPRAELFEIRRPQAEMA